MDAVMFAKEYLRMCGNFSNCEKCPLLPTYFCTINAKAEKSHIDVKEVVRIVEEWSTAHQRKTRQSVFLEQFPNTPCVANDAIMDSGTIRLYPCQLGYSRACDSSGYKYVQDGGECSPKDCLGCRGIFWTEPVK